MEHELKKDKAGFEYRAPVDLLPEPKRRLSLRQRQEKHAIETALDMARMYWTLGTMADSLAARYIEEMVDLIKGRDDESLFRARWLRVLSGQSHQLKS